MMIQIFTLQVCNIQLLFLLIKYKLLLKRMLLTSWFASEF